MITADVKLPGKGKAVGLVKAALVKNVVPAVGWISSHADAIICLLT